MLGDEPLGSQLGEIVAERGKRIAVWGTSERLDDVRVYLRRGKAIAGGDVREAPVTPADLGATVFRHLGIDLTAQWTDSQGRPQSIVTGGGRPIPELS